MGSYFIDLIVRRCISSSITAPSTTWDMEKLRKIRMIEIMVIEENYCRFLNIS